ncbi:MAG: protein translocase SEC61 complex subunit gamma [Nanoarchaeota archaeon]|nr:protein translocase SEC61 complex subunit gamma [Nanoarchaeota archaeon]MBU0977569.1 protein translocase SEC61 complex subunit gamma [Nanoarchaeota archaeon]
MAITERIKSFIVQSKRVWHVLRKPTGEEFKTVSKVSAIGILILGALGFLIADGIRLINGFFV